MSKSKSVMTPPFRYCSLPITRRRLAGLIVGLAVIFSGHSWAQQLERVAVLEQWPGISQMIAYRDRIWLVNSEPFKDNNSADVYSYSIQDKSLRYERSLFSQDVGAPVVFNDLLHWPFEDPRRSAGSGEYAVTDGSNWRWQSMRSGSVMHVHAMNVCDDELVAATGSWTGQLHRQQSQNNWQVQYDYPAAKSSFSRIVSVIQLNDDCIIGTSAKRKKEAKLFTLKADIPIPVPGWPESDRVDNLTRHQQSIFAFADTGSERQLLRYDGVRTHKVAIPNNHRPRALHSNGDTLWLLTHNPNNKDGAGFLWQYNNDDDLKNLQQFSAMPISLTSLNGFIAIGTYKNSGAELLLYNTNVKSSRDQQSTTVLTPTSSQQLSTALVESLYIEIRDIVSDPQSTQNYARALRRNLSRHPQLETPEFGVALTRVLEKPVEGAPTTMFTGQSISRNDLTRWYLITALAVNGNGRIEPDWINPNTELVVPDSAKVFDPSIASIVASGWLKQGDKETLQALITRLNKKSDPLWVKADVVGALTAISDQRFAYDIAAWNRWWDQQ